MATERIFSWMPDSLLFLIGGCILGFIYYCLPEDSQKSINKKLREFGFPIFLFLFWLYYKGKWGLVAESEFWGQMRFATFIIGLIGILYFAFKNFLYEMRYNTRQIIANNFHGSCHFYKEMGDWVLFLVGGCGYSDESWTIPWPWIKKVLVAPKVACQFFGDQILVRSQVQKCDLIDLPEDVADEIEKHTFARWCKDSIYFGVWDEETKARNPKYVEIELILKKTQDRVNELKEMLKGKLSTMKQYVSDTLAMQDKLKGKGWRREDQPRND